MDKCSIYLFHICVPYICTHAFKQILMSAKTTMVDVNTPVTTQRAPSSVLVGQVSHSTLLTTPRAKVINC